MRVALVCIAKNEDNYIQEWVDLIEVNKIKKKYRGENGFGSTGI
jgi:dUTPase